jgi:hypothetical protein
MTQRLTQTKLLKAIRKKCLDCSCYQFKEVDLCPIKDCSLYPFRSGKNPFKKQKLGGRPFIAQNEKVHA